MTPLLSIIVPVYNEAGTIAAVLERVRDRVPLDKEVIVVNDGSSDDTAAILKSWADVPDFLVLHHTTNQGKSAAIRTGLAHARGAITIIQDADLEYDPADIAKLVEVIDSGRADVVYGSRYLAPARPLPWSIFRVGVCLFNLIVRLLYGQKLTDEATCYKAFRTSLLRRLDIQATRFDFCPEVTAKLCRRGLAIQEMPIAYFPRPRQAGKKIGWLDGLVTIWTLVKWRFRSEPDWKRNALATIGACQGSSKKVPATLAADVGSKLQRL